MDSRVLTAMLMAIGMLLKPSSVGGVDAGHVTSPPSDSDGEIFYDSPTVLQHLLVRESTRDIFIGGVNHISRLSPMLQLEDTVTTGPRPEGNLSVDHHSKGLVLDQANRELLACGNLNQGKCFRHSLDKLATVTPISAAVVGSSVDPTFAATVLLKDYAGQKLVVATSVSQVNNQVPALIAPPLLSTRDIDTLGLVDNASQWKLVDEASNFEIVYRSGYVSGHFAYILSARPAVLNGVVFSSHISRVCVEDKSYRSLVEAPLLCEVDGVQYNVLETAHVGTAGVNLRLAYNPNLGEELLYAVFSKSHPAGLTRTQRSALCVYSLKDIEHTLGNAIMKCFQGEGHLGPEHFWPSSTLCIKSDLPVDGNYCGEHDINFPVESQTSISPVLSKAFDNTQLSAVVSSVLDDHTVVYLGSGSGQLFKVELTKDKVVHYKTVQVTDGDPILPDIYLTPDESYLYILSSRKVARLKMSSCDSSQNCDECLTSADPHCGWCLATNRCMSESLCKMEGHTWGWLQTRRQTCPQIQSVQPKSFHENTTVTVTVELSFVPKTSIDCIMKIGSDTHRAEAVGTGQSSLTCHNLRVPQLPLHKESASVNLELHLNHTPWLTTLVSVYTCTVHTSCTECRKSVRCEWCVESSRCTQANTCVNGPVIRPQNGQCPQINESKDYELLLHSGAVGTVHLTALHLPQVIKDSRLTCHLGNETVTASLSEEKNGESLVTCGKVTLSYAQDSAFSSAPLAVSWGPLNHRLDNPHHVQLRLYNCKYMVTSCGQCLALDSRYGCGYCQNDCSTADNCPTTWRNESYVCPNPKITRVSKLSGPLGGSTRLTVHGINLGNSVREILGGVTVAGEPCAVLDEHFEPSTSFICLTGRSNVSKKGSVQVNVSNLYSTQTSVSFTYVDPVLESMEPRLGPQSGGTNITLRGHNLNVGTSVSVTFRSAGSRVRRQTEHALHARVYSRDSNRILFQSPKQDAAQSKSVYVTVDGNDFLLEGAPFTFVLDPIISSVSPLVTTVSGGTQVSVTGDRLDTVQDPKLVVYTGNQQVISKCVANDTTQMTCTMPYLAGVNLGATMENPKNLDYGFIMDGVTSLLNVTNQSDLDPFICYPDPTLTPLDDDLRYNSQEVLVISGRNFRVFEKVPGGKILVGGSPCRNMAFNDTNLSCTPPKEPVDLHEGSAEVVVVLNGYRGSAGWLGYENPSILGGKLPLVLGVVLGVAVPIIIVIIVILCRLCRQNKTEKKRQEKLRQSLTDIEDPAAVPLTQVPRIDRRVTERMPLKTEVLRCDEDGAQSEEDVTAERSEDGASQNGELLSELQVNDVVNGIVDKQLRNTVQEVLIERARLNLGDVMGKGHFGCVYAGTLAPKDSSDEEQSVAVKTLQGRTFDQDAVESFLKEGVMMRNFDHPHVLKLLGVCLPEGGYPMVILPFMANGDLRNYVKNKERSFTARQLLHLAQQVAEGMAYLASLRFVHRDLAARNCMIDNTTNVKVADFGLSKDLYERDYYSGMDRRKKMPIKWMAIESLEEYLFTTKSDVWSFGILMWELLTRGVTPYPDVDIFEIRNYLATGRRLRQPKFCPDNVYAIMVECWKAAPTERPTFADLVNRLELIINPPKKRESSESFDEPLYVNVKRPVSESDCLEKGL